MTRDCFTSICGLLKGKDVFSNISVPFELLYIAFSKYTGACGGESTALSMVFFLG